VVNLYVKIVEHREVCNTPKVHPIICSRVLSCTNRFREIWWNRTLASPTEVVTTETSRIKWRTKIATQCTQTTTCNRVVGGIWTAWVGLLDHTITFLLAITWTTLTRVKEIRWTLAGMECMELSMVVHMRVQESTTDTMLSLTRGVGITGIVTWVLIKWLRDSHKTCLGKTTNTLLPRTIWGVVPSMDASKTTLTEILGVDRMGKDRWEPPTRERLRWRITIREETLWGRGAENTLLKCNREWISTQITTMEEGEHSLLIWVTNEQEM
jgi:hypothetical protein